MDTKNLNTFVQVAEMGNFTRAGEKLGYSQSTISFQIRQLEIELGVPLFERINRTVTLTEAGVRLLASAHRINAELKSFAQAGSPTDHVRGTVRLALADSLCVSLVDRVFPDLHRAWPDITLHCDTAGTNDLLRGLDRNESDLVYIMDSPVYNAHYKTLKKIQVSTHFICSPHNPLAGQAHVSLDELLSQPFLLTEKGMSYRRLLDEKMAARGREILPVFVSGDTYLICDLVAKGCGVSLLPDYACRPMLEAGELCAIRVDEDLCPEVFAQLLRHRDKWVSEPIRIVGEFLGSYPL